MRLNDTTIWLLILAASIFTGVIFNSLWLQLVLLIGLSVLLILIGFIIDLIVKGNKWIRIFGFTFFFFVFSVIFAFTIQKIRIKKEKGISSFVINSLKDFHKAYGFYPINVDTLKVKESILKDFKKNQTYQCDEKQQEFKIQFSINDFEVNTYFSQNSLWYSDDDF